jgi:hypothetical protein
MYLAYLIAIIVFIVAIVFPLLFDIVNNFTASTAAYALQISRTGNLPIPAFTRGFWQDSLGYEDQFWVPSLLLSIFMQVTGLPEITLILIPITGLATIIYFVLARRLLHTREDGKHIGLLFAALAYAYIICNNMEYFVTVSRSSLGVVLLAYFMFSYIMYLRLGGREQHEDKTAWLILVALFTFTIGYAYYSSLLAIFACTALILCLSLFAPAVKRARWGISGLPIAFLSLALLTFGPFIQAIQGLIPQLTPQAFVENTVLYVTALLKLDQGTQQYLLAAGAVNPSVFDRVTGIWIRTALELISSIAIVYAIIAYRPRRGQKLLVIWLFSLGTLFFGISELGYLFLSPTAPVRFIAIFGIIVMFYIVNDKISQSEGFPNVGLPLVSTRAKRRLVAVLLIVVVVTAAIGEVDFSWNNGIEKPFGYQQIEPVSSVLIAHSSPRSPIVLRGDAYYTGEVFYVAAVNNKLDSLIPEPLESDALLLYQSSITKNAGALVKDLRARNIGFLLIISEGTPTWADAWGPSYAISSNSSLPFSLVYDDGSAYLYAVS